MTREQIENVFTFHPAGKNATKYELLREKAKYLALEINALCPDTHERNLALTRLRETIMWANAAIACNEDSF